MANDTDAGEPAENPVVGASGLGVLERRRIEAAVLGPMLHAFQERFGKDETRETAQQVITEIARGQGAEMAAFLGGDDLVTFGANKDPWRKGGALEVEELERSSTAYSFNVTRCGYADMYKKMGHGDLGDIFSCTRDFEFSRGFNAKIRLTRTQTIMQGAAYCDFRYTLEADETNASNIPGGETEGSEAPQ
jgi:hypothetical protein